MLLWIIAGVFFAIVSFSLGIIYRGAEHNPLKRLFPSPQTPDSKPSFIDNIIGVPEGKKNEACKYAAAGAATGLVLGLAGGAVVALSLGIVGMVLTPRYIYTFNKEKFKRNFRKGFPRSVNLIVAYSTTGPLAGAFKKASEDLSEPVAGVYRYISDCISSGYSVYAAVKKTGEDYELPELVKFAENIRIVEELGGGEKTREVLESTAEYVRFAERFRLSVEANLSEIKGSAAIANILPLVIFAGLALLVPDSDHRYVLLHDRTLLYFGLGAIGAGWIYVSNATKKFRNTIT
jgi:Flp pilus assembly protein TadB